MEKEEKGSEGRAGGVINSVTFHGFEHGGDASDWFASPGSFCSAECSQGLNVPHSFDHAQFDTCEVPSVFGPHNDMHPSCNSIPTFEPRDKPISFLKLMKTILQHAMTAHIGLNHFIRLSVQPISSRNVHSASRGTDLWPCPVPLWRWTGSSRLSPKRRQRREFLQVRAQLLQCVVATLNWECLGHPVKPPPSACAGYKYSDAQLDMLDRLERLIDHFLQAGPLSSHELGRSGEKFNHLLRAAKELPEIREVDLYQLATDLAHHFDSYSKPGGSGNEESFVDPRNSTSDDLGECRLPKSVAKPVIASRIKWEHSPGFDPLPFFEDQIVKDAFIDPSRVKLPSELWPHQPRGKVHCSKSELLALAEKWDSKGACLIFRKDEILMEEAVGMFGVPKDDLHDRLILNPQTANSRLKKFSHYTRELAPGSMFALIWLQKGQSLRVSADDLAEMYYTFKVPPSRAKRNSVGLIFSGHELSHLSCYDSSKHVGPCVVALNALAMGDSWAVEFAQQSHHNVLRILAGSMLEHQRVAYRKPFPRGTFMEWLAIDDHIGVQIVDHYQKINHVPLRDNEVFSQAEKAYRAVGLVQHPKKKQRHVSSGVFLGAELDGDVGVVSAPRHRVGTLMLVTILLAQRGTASPRLLSCVLGCWIHVLMFRRPVMAILSHAFSDGRGLPQDKIFQLSRQTRNELYALTVLGPLCMSDLRVNVCPKIFCTDASPFGAGICEASESPEVVAELWRHSEQKGYYTQLLNPSASILKELGEAYEVPDLPDHDADPLDSAYRVVPSVLSEGLVYDCLELFCGEGNWSSSHFSIGFKVHPGIDIKGTGLKFADMLDNSVYHQLLSLAARGVVGDWHAGPPCRTYGTLRRPRIRSKRFPAGFNMRDPLTREQTLLALRTAFIMNLVMFSGRWFSVEQPGSSVMFYLDVFKRLVYRGAVVTRLCFCVFGSPFKKPSQWLHNKPWLLELEQPCKCQSPDCHFVIEGTFTYESVKRFNSMCKPSALEVYGREPCVGEAVASFSASYPKSLCQRMAAGAWQSRHDSELVIPMSARVRSLKRVGEHLHLPADLNRESLAASRPFHEDPEWIEELSDSLQFRELLRYKFHKGGHINVLECRVHKTLLKHCAYHFPNSRFLALLDSRVSLGATAKGRSSSRAICRVLQGSLGYILGGCLYPGGLHICSSKNRSDAPSRNRPVPLPSKETPIWLESLRVGDYSRFDVTLQASRFTKLAARWLRLLLLLGGDIERNPGPRKPQHKRQPRGPLDLSVGVTPATSSRMQSCLADFATWLFDELGLKLDQIAWDCTAAPLALRAYGMQLYSSGAARYRFVYTLTGMQDCYPHLRPHLSAAWQVDRKWQQHEPGTCRPVISAPLMRAISAVAILWNWPRWLGITLIGFLGMLHPAEFISLTRADILLPEDSLIKEDVFYVFIRCPKTSRFARRQHCKIDDPLVLKFITKVFGGLQASSALFSGGATAYRRRWNSILSRLEVPFLQEHDGCTPAVLRGSGATHMFLSTEDLPRVQWRGRWAQQKTLEFYVQEVAAQTMLSRLSPSAFERVKLLDQFAVALLNDFIFVDQSK